MQHTLLGCSHVIRFTLRGQLEMQKQLSVELSIHDIYIYIWHQFGSVVK